MRWTGLGKSAGKLAAVVLGGSVLSVGAVLWMGLRLLEQDAVLERQQDRERQDSALDTAVAKAGRALAQTGQLMMTETWSPEGRGAVLVRQKNGLLTVTPPGGLAFLPLENPVRGADNQIFAEMERDEFQRNDWRRAATDYQRMAASRDVNVRAGALVRLARVQAKAGLTNAARESYRSLAALENGMVDGVPAPLVAMLALGSGAELGTTLEHPKQIPSRDVFLFHAERAESLSGGRWRRDREREALAEAVHGVWPAEEGNGRRVEGELTLIWSRIGDHTAVLAAGPAYRDREWLGGSLALGSNGATGRAARVTGLPWDVRLRGGEVAIPGLFSGRRRMLAAGTLAVPLLLLLTGYLSWRAVTKEQAAGRMQVEFVAAVSHEFRTPLTAMKQFTGMLLERHTMTEAQRQACFEALARSTERLSHLVDSLLDFRRMEAGARPYTMEPLDLAALVRRVAQEFGSEQRTAVPVTAPEVCQTEADAGALSLALWNLLDNAVKYGGNAVVEMETADGEAKIRVTDQGPGIPDSEKRYIFDRFVRGEQAQRMGVNGTGIGLAMVKHVAEAHRGRVEVESEIGRGSTFTMVLPVGE